MTRSLLRTCLDCKQQCVDCRHCWELANPALGDFLARDRLVACLPRRCGKRRSAVPGCAS
jgi:hypothetical protein